MEATNKEDSSPELTSTSNGICATKLPHSGKADALNLLKLWDLPELYDVFLEHEISTRSLKYLTDAEIIELIPKIGPRTIFRALLTEWRSKHNTKSIQNFQKSAYKRNYANAFPYENTTLISNEAVKKETPTDESELDYIDTEPTCLVDENISLQSELLDNSANSKHSGELSLEQNGAQNFGSESEGALELGRFICNKVQIDYKDYNGERLMVYDLLSTSYEGQCALDHYKQYGFLDTKNRKRVVHVLIKAVVERRMHKYTAVFHDITRQLLELFPNEKYDTYFVPHHGANPARGALYYKYSNYTRQLRREGLLEYKNQRNRNSY